MITENERGGSKRHWIICLKRNAMPWIFVYFLSRSSASVRDTIWILVDFYWHPFFTLTTQRNDKENTPKHNNKANSHTEFWALCLTSFFVIRCCRKKKEIKMKLFSSECITKRATKSTASCQSFAQIIYFIEVVCMQILFSRTSLAKLAPNKRPKLVIILISDLNIVITWGRA